MLALLYQKFRVGKTNDVFPQGEMEKSKSVEMNVCIISWQTGACCGESF